VGDDLGKIHIYDVGETVAIPRSDECQRFVHTLADLKSNQAEQDDDLSKPLR
jgi:dynein intermediate chain